MNLQDLKIGDKVSHFCFGKLVDAEVIEVQNNWIRTKHEGVQWGRDIYVNTFLNQSTWLQMDYYEKKGECLATSPKAFYNGGLITSNK